MLSAAPRASLTLPSCSPNYPRASRIGWTHARHCPFLKCRYDKIFDTYWRKWRHFLKNTARVDILIVSTAIRTRNNKIFGSYIRAIFYINLFVIPISRLGETKINGGSKFSEIKVQNPLVLMSLMGWNFARYLRKTCRVRKCEKCGYRAWFHQSGTLVYVVKYVLTLFKRRRYI